MTNETNSNEGCLSAVLRFFGFDQREQDVAADEVLPYHLRDHFLSPAEMSLYHILYAVVGERAVVCPKVGLRDIFYVGRPHENWSYRQRIAQKHVDFLLCEPKTMQPMVGVELDDASHNRPDRQARDEHVDRVFEVAGLALVHIQAQMAYNTSELSAKLVPYLGEAAAVAKTTDSVVENAPPLCRKCGVAMVVRTVKRGQYQGRQFYGCPNYPECREMLPLDR